MKSYNLLVNSHVKIVRTMKRYYIATSFNKTYYKEEISINE